MSTKDREGERERYKHKITSKGRGKEIEDKGERER